MSELEHAGNGPLPSEMYYPNPVETTVPPDVTGFAGQLDDMAYEHTERVRAAKEASERQERLRETLSDVLRSDTRAYAEKCTEAGLPWQHVQTEIRGERYKNLFFWVAIDQTSETVHTPLHVISVDRTIAGAPATALTTIDREGKATSETVGNLSERAKDQEVKIRDLRRYFLCVDPTGALYECYTWLPQSERDKYPLKNFAQHMTELVLPANVLANPSGFNTDEQLDEKRVQKIRSNWQGLLVKSFDYYRSSEAARRQDVMALAEFPSPTSAVVGRESGVTKAGAAALMLCFGAFVALSELTDELDIETDYQRSKQAVVVSELDARCLASPPIFPELPSADGGAPVPVTDAIRWDATSNELQTSAGGDVYIHTDSQEVKVPAGEHIDTLLVCGNDIKVTIEPGASVDDMVVTGQGMNAVVRGEVGMFGFVNTDGFYDYERYVDNADLDSGTLTEHTS